jgi:hypothetical protein
MVNPHTFMVLSGAHKKNVIPEIFSRESTYLYDLSGAQKPILSPRMGKKMSTRIIKKCHSRNLLAGHGTLQGESTYLYDLSGDHVVVLDPRQKKSGMTSLLKGMDSRQKTSGMNVVQFFPATPWRSCK